MCGVDHFRTRLAFGAILWCTAATVTHCGAAHAQGYGLAGLWLQDEAGPRGFRFEMNAGAQAFGDAWSLYSGVTAAPFAALDREGVREIREAGTPYHEAVADQVALYPPFEQRGGQTFLHDPLAAAAVIRPDLLGWHELAIDVELAGRLTTGTTVARQPGPEHPATARAAMEVDAVAAERFILDRICVNS